MNFNLIRTITSLCLLPFPFIVQAQADYADKVSTWKNQFPKEDVIAYQHKQVINFSVNKNATPEKIKATVTTELTLVPVKDYVRYEDGLF
ncbi:MAG TPA: hypothetical protein VGG71_16575, partial [Chitinophagaceae bacterium]